MKRKLKKELDRLCFPDVVHLNGKEFDRWIKSPRTMQVGDVVCVASAPAMCSFEGLITVESLKRKQAEFQPTPILDSDGNVVGIVNRVTLNENRLEGVIESSETA